jgi:hypothetical protein
MVGQRVSDTTSGFRAVNRNALRLFAAQYPHDYPEVESMVLLLHVDDLGIELGNLLHSDLADTVRRSQHRGQALEDSASKRPRCQSIALVTTEAAPDTVGIRVRGEPSNAQSGTRGRGVDDDDPHGDVSVPVMLAVLSVELDRTREPLT